MAEPLAPAASHDHDHKPHGWRRWVYATNHKDIGTMYLVFACTMFFIGGFMAILIRLELFKPGLQFFDPQFFNSMTTMHALIMELKNCGSKNCRPGLKSSSRIWRCRASTTSVSGSCRLRSRCCC